MLRSRFLRFLKIFSLSLLTEVMSYPMWYGGMPGMPMDSHAAERQMQEYARLQQEDAKRRMEEEFQRQKLEEQMRCPRDLQSS